ncbi:MAG: hypothetical protein K0S77_3777 [Pseudomonas sp.]|jgi:hypothetical protein|nr:hypothetical protein [Pseudomonas sp.]
MTNLIEMKTAELSGEALGWAVGMAEGLTLYLDTPIYGNGWRVFVIHRAEATGRYERYAPWESWALGGPLIENRMVSLHCPQSTDDVWAGWVITDSGEFCQAGNTALIAACRAIVAARLGDTVQVPKELMP